MPALPEMSPLLLLSLCGISVVCLGLAGLVVFLSLQLAGGGLLEYVITLFTRDAKADVPPPRRPTPQDRPNLRAKADAADFESALLQAQAAHVPPPSLAPPPSLPGYAPAQAAPPSLAEMTLYSTPPPPSLAPPQGQQGYVPPQGAFLPANPGSLPPPSSAATPQGFVPAAPPTLPPDARANPSTSAPGFGPNDPANVFPAPRALPNVNSSVGYRQGRRFGSGYGGGRVTGPSRSNVNTNIGPSRSDPRPSRPRRSDRVSDDEIFGGVLDFDGDGSVDS